MQSGDIVWIALKIGWVVEKYIIQQDKFERFLWTCGSEKFVSCSFVQELQSVPIVTHYQTYLNTHRNFSDPYTQYVPNN